MRVLVCQLTNVLSEVAMNLVMGGNTSCSKPTSSKILRGLCLNGVEVFDHGLDTGSNDLDTGTLCADVNR